MKKIRLLTWVLTLSFLLSACVATGGDPDQNIPTPPDNQKVVEEDNDIIVGPDEDNADDDVASNQYPAELVVELVVEWEMTDAILSLLDELADYLRSAIEEAGCPLDRVTLTISTAAGFTAQALLDGGVDAAIMPAIDIIAHEKRASILALSGEGALATAIVLSSADEALTEEFQSIFLRALTETQQGADFLSACCGGAVFSSPTEEALQTVRDYLAELEDAEGDDFQ